VCVCFRCAGRQLTERSMRAPVLRAASASSGTGAYYAQPALIENSSTDKTCCAGDLRPASVCDAIWRLRGALTLHDAVRQGLALSIFTNDVREAELFLSARGSDCGIAIVNIGPSVRRSTAKSTPTGAASPTQMHGSLICGARTTPSTTAERCPSPGRQVRQRLICAFSGLATPHRCHFS